MNGDERVDRTADITSRLRGLVDKAKDVAVPAAETMREKAVEGAQTVAEKADRGVRAITMEEWRREMEGAIEDIVLVLRKQDADIARLMEATGLRDE